MLLSGIYNKGGQDAYDRESVTTACMSFLSWTAQIGLPVVKRNMTTVAVGPTGRQEQSGRRARSRPVQGAVVFTSSFLPDVPSIRTS